MQKKYGKFYADWFDENGKRRRKTFRTKGAALTYQPRKATAGHSSKKRPAHNTIAALCGTWAEGTPRSCNRNLVAEEVTRAFGHLNPPQLTTLMTESLITGWRKHYAPWTIYTRRQYLGRLLHALEEHGGPRLKLARIKMPQPRSVTAQPGEIKAALSKAKPHERLLILLCWQTALRSGEALRVTPASWNRQNATIQVLTKGGKVRTIPTTTGIDELLAVAEQQAKEPDESAIAALHGKSLTRNAVNTAWWRLKQAAGINPELRLHDLRRTTYHLAPLHEEQLREMQKLLDFKSEVRQ